MSSSLVANHQGNAILIGIFAAAISAIVFYTLSITISTATNIQGIVSETAAVSGFIENVTNAVSKNNECEIEFYDKKDQLVNLNSPRKKKKTIKIFKKSITRIEKGVGSQKVLVVKKGMNLGRGLVISSLRLKEHPKSKNVLDLTIGIGASVGTETKSFNIPISVEECKNK